MYELIFNPGTDEQERIAFTVSEADLENALDYGRAEASDSIQKQMANAAYHKVMDLGVCDDVERVCEEPWVVVQRGRIIARNVQAIDITEADLA